MSKLEEIMGKINKQYKEEIVVYGARNMVYATKIPFSSPRLNYMTYGGFPLGKATEFIGPENGGKTTTAIDAIANAQMYALDEWEGKIEPLEAELAELKEKNNKTDKKRIGDIESQLETLKATGPRRVVLVDSENTFDDEWAELNGVDVDALWLIRPQHQTAEQVLQMMLDILDTGEVILMVLDSIPMLVSQKLYEEDLEKKAYGGIADVMAQFSAKVSRIISRHHTALIMINQIRDNLANPYDLWHTPGGRALRHLYALRLGFRKGSLIDENNKEIAQRSGEPYGNKVDVTIVKTKVCKPDRRVGFYTLNYTHGIDVVADTVETAVKYGLVTVSGSWYYLMDMETGEIATKDGESMRWQGYGKIIQALREDDETFDTLYNKVHSLVTKTG